MEFIAVKFEWNRFIFLKIKLTIKLIQLAPKTLDRIFFKKIKNKKKIVDFISVHSDTARLLINDTHAGKVSPPPPRSSLKASGPLSDTFDPKIGQQWQRCKLGNFFFFFFFYKNKLSVAVKVNVLTFDTGLCIYWTACVSDRWLVDAFEPRGALKVDGASRKMRNQRCKWSDNLPTKKNKK